MNEHKQILTEHVHRLFTESSVRIALLSSCLCQNPLLVVYFCMYYIFFKVVHAGKYFSDIHYWLRTWLGSHKNH